MDNLVNQLNQQNTTVVYEILREINDRIVLSTENRMPKSIMEKLLPEIVRLINLENAKNINILACQTLVNLLVVFPFCSPKVSQLAIPSLIAKLLSIEDIDLAENALEILEKLSYEENKQILRQGGLMAVLAFSGFFSMFGRQKALSAVANMTRDIPENYFKLISDSIPLLIQQFECDNEKVLDLSCLSMFRIFNQFIESPEKVQILANEKFVSELLGLLFQQIQKGSKISPSTFSSILGLLADLCKVYPKTIIYLHEHGVIKLLQIVFSQQNLILKEISGKFSKKQIFQILSLAESLLPFLPNDILPNIMISPNDDVEKSKKSIGYTRKITVNEEIWKKQIEFFEVNLQLIADFSLGLLPNFIQFQTELVLQRNRAKCLLIIFKCFFFLDAKFLSNILQNYAKETTVVITELITKELDPLRMGYAIHFATILMHKSPEIFTHYFFQHGIFYEISKIAKRKGNLIFKTIENQNQNENQNKIEKQIENQNENQIENEIENENENQIENQNENQIENQIENENENQIENPKKKEKKSRSIRIKNTQKIPKTQKEHSNHKSRLYRKMKSDSKLATTEKLKSKSNPKLKLKLKSNPKLKLKSKSKSKPKPNPEENNPNNLNNNNNNQKNQKWIDVLQKYCSENELKLHESNCEKAALFVSQFGKLVEKKLYSTQRVKILRRRVLFLHNPEKEMEYLIKTKLMLMSRQNSFSVFELHKSQFLIEFFRYLNPLSENNQNENVQNENIPNENNMQFENNHKFESKIEKIEKVFFKTTKSKDPNKAPLMPIQILIAKLQEVFSKYEMLFVFTFPWMDITVVGNSVNIQFQKHPDELGLNEYRKKSLSISCTTTTNELEDMIFQNVHLEDDPFLLGNPHFSINTSKSPFSRLKSALSIGKEHNHLREFLEMLELHRKFNISKSSDSESTDKSDTDSDSSDSSDEDDSYLNSKIRGFDRKINSLEKKITKLEMKANKVKSSPLRQTIFNKKIQKKRLKIESTIQKKDRFLRNHPPKKKKRNSRSSMKHQRKTKKSKEKSNNINPFKKPPNIDNLPKKEEQAVENQLKKSLHSSFHPLHLTYQGKIIQTNINYFPQIFLIWYQNSENKGISSFWDSIHVIQYQRLNPDLEQIAEIQQEEYQYEKSKPVNIENTQRQKEQYKRITVDDTILSQQLNSDFLLDFGDDSSPFVIEDFKASLQLLYILYYINEYFRFKRIHAKIPTIDNTQTSTINDAPNYEFLHPNQFISSKLTSKILVCLEDPFVVLTQFIPIWCRRMLWSGYHFLVPFHVRVRFFKLFSLESLRSFHHFHSFLEHHIEKSLDFELPRIPRHKIQVSRENILENAMQIMSTREALGASILEIEYFGEVGVGSGPSQEFFVLVSQELRKKTLNLWSDMSQNSFTNDSENIYVNSPNGLFPKPLADSYQYLMHLQNQENSLNLDQNPSVIYIEPSEEIRKENEKILALFEFMGKFVAKALSDERMIDLPFSEPFYRFFLKNKLTFTDLEILEPELARSLKELSQIAKQYRRTKDKSIKYRDSSIEDLYLSFVMPSDNIELKPNGKNIDVTLENLHEYIDLIINIRLHAGIQRQIDAFRSGFNEILPWNSLKIFNYEEFDFLVNGCSEIWTKELLKNNIKCEHGYSSESQVVEFFVEFLLELSPNDQRKFLQFITGSSRLPVGGIAKLSPTLTIVERIVTPFDPDSFLPTVMTCANYLKIPRYSSKSILAEKFTIAINEGQSSFHLS
ncbi:e3 ubiquitin-protein ligase trip12 [Anaeramoeba ignava]|uniref:HECT-type E3 ubiquitin transferase n=1 Tax=Anaeramoeba ignava TaxID=1746090 RepID=A0A9Q0LL15_ANAIG|nr:e3 ubiquitin-protein ligase trip12 [Anaeramoeba ignava]